jgi:hypothetical protein
MMTQKQQQSERGQRIAKRNASERRSNKLLPLQLAVRPVPLLLPRKDLTKTMTSRMRRPMAIRHRVCRL